MYLIYDTETTGLPVDYKASAENTDNWPRIVQIAWMLFDKNRRLVNADASIFGYSEEIENTPEAFAKHGIGEAAMKLYGIDHDDIMLKFGDVLTNCEFTVAHNHNFDSKIVRAQFHRTGYSEYSENMKQKTPICTMLKSMKYCGIPGKNGRGIKWPSLDELHMTLFKEPVHNAHNAMIDVMATAKCFFTLVDIDVIKLES